MINSKSGSLLPPPQTRKLKPSSARKITNPLGDGLKPSKFYSSSSSILVPPAYIPPSYTTNRNISNPARKRSKVETHEDEVEIQIETKSNSSDSLTDLDADGSEDEEYVAQGSQGPVAPSAIFPTTDDDDLPDLPDHYTHPRAIPSRVITIPTSSPEKAPATVKKKVQRRIQIVESEDEVEDSDEIEVVGSSAGESSKPRRKAIIHDDDDDEDEVVIVSAKAPKPESRKRKQAAVVSDGDDSDWDSRRASRKEDAGPSISDVEALEFFNTCDIADLPAVTACTIEQAKIIASLRPFEDPEDMKKKLRKRKGVSSAVFTQYQEVMKGYIEVDRVLTKCEAHGAELSKIMSVWAGMDESSTPDVDGAVDLINVVSNSSHPAMKGYLYNQPKSIPSGIKLKAYQLLGLNWLNLLYRKRISCILADEMGLGKTAQVVTFLSHLKLSGRPGPHLVIVPASTLDNWTREFKTFSSNLVVRTYYGNQVERADLRYELKGLEDLDVILTTYNVASGAPDDRKFLDRMRFDACVYDEGHQLKNSESKKYKDLMRMRVQWRLLLTGTPLQNNLQELVSLLSFILPTIFENAKEDLRMIFKVPVEAQVNLLAQTRVTRAKKMMSPFVLRRKKAQVLSELPKKIEEVMYCELIGNQKALYDEALSRSKKSLLTNEIVVDDLDDLDEEEEGKKKKKKNEKKKSGTNGPLSTNILMELRKASNHPMLFRRLYTDQTIRQMAKACLKELEFHDRNVELIFEDMEVMTDFELHLFSTQYKQLNKFALKNEEWMNAGKIEKLKELVISLRSKGSRILVFSQFTQMLAILEKVMECIGVKFLILTGSTSVGERQPLVDQFTNDESITVFLLSTKAGGLGLNLMAADTVVIFDQDFNPHNDRQAEDRAYRLGQKRDVHVIKFITKKTIEEDILQLAQTKIALDTSVSTDHQKSSTDDSNNPNTTTSSSGVALNAEPLSEKAVKSSLMATLRKRIME